MRGGGEGEGGGGIGCGGGLDGSGLGGSMKRGPQSVQSVPYAQVPPVTPSSHSARSGPQPSWQYPLFA